MLQALGKKPWLVFRYARRMAGLHASMHASSISPELPDQHGRLARKIQNAAPLPLPVRSRAIDALSALPSGDRICHGDFHPGNILLSSNGEIVIDWIDASRGNPLADVARTSILALGFAATDPSLLKLNGHFIRLFHAIYVRQYFLLAPGGKSQYRRWLPVVAAARLSEGITELEDWLLQTVRKGFGN